MRQGREEGQAQSPAESPGSLVHFHRGEDSWGKEGCELPGVCNKAPSSLRDILGQSNQRDSGAGKGGK